LTDSLGNRALGGVSATLLWQAVRVGLLGVSIVVLARLLSPEDYGLLAMVTAVIGVGELLRDLGLSVAAVQARTLDKGEKTNLFWANTFTGVVLMILIFCASWPIAAMYGEPDLVLITQVLSVTFLLNGTASQFKAQINRDLRFMVLGIAEAVPQAIGLAVAIWLAILFHSYWALVAQALVVSLVALVLDIIFSRWFPGLPRLEVSIRKFLRFGGALAGTQGLAYVAKNVDTVALGIFFGAGPLGYYSRAYQLIVLPLNQLTAPLSRVAIPILSRIQDDRAQFLRYLRTGQFFTVTFASLFYASLIGLAAPIVLVVLGPQWLPAVPVLRALAVSGIFRAMGQVPYWIFVSRGLTGKQFRTYLASQPLVIAAILAGVPWGVEGVAIGCSVGYFVFWFIQMWWAGRSSGLPTGRLVRSGLSLVLVLGVPASAIGLAATTLIADPLVALLVGLAAVAIYAGTALVAIRPYRRQIITVRSVISRRRNG
jgi:O-antigen/teichoic acid export membrane protein